jgi:hypothetical protein
MTPEKEKILTEKYPKIFLTKEENSPFSIYLFQHGDGWFNIIDTLCSVIQHHTDWKRKREPFAGMTDEEFEEIHQPTASQVKEKFGGLRFYCDNADDYVQGAITFAESMSYRTCEDCGAQGSKRPGGWVRTLCDKCDQRNKDPNVSC